MSSIPRTDASEANAHSSVASGRPILALITRLHFFAGLFIGPFILLAAFSGLLYAITPQLENWLYSEHLYTDSQGPTVPLAAQIEAAHAHLGGSAASLAAVRPAPEAGHTTRVMFAVDGLKDYEHRAVFIDPVTVASRGDLTVYGTTGVLPVRNWIGDLHRRMFLGDWGRLYSELAASWLWLIALGGLTIWLSRSRYSHPIVSGQAPRLRHWHGLVGVALLIALLFFSATGLTWSKWAGENIGIARAAFNMSTPGLSTRLPGQGEAVDEHGDHHHETVMADTVVDYSIVDEILANARAAGIDASKLEITPALSSSHAWSVVEIDRSWPTQVDAVAIDPRSMAVVDQIIFNDFPVAAKLTRWGIDAHMGSLFGLVNQLILIVSALGVLAMVLMGYLIWWRRRPTRKTDRQGVLETWGRLTPSGRAGLAVIALLLGISIPVFGASFLLLLSVDVIAGSLKRRAKNRKQSQRIAAR